MEKFADEFAEHVVVAIAADVFGMGGLAELAEATYEAHKVSLN